MSLRKPPKSEFDPKEGFPYADSGSGRHCYRCGRWRIQLGGTTSKRTGLWVCVDCKDCKKEIND